MLIWEVPGGPFTLSLKRVRTFQENLMMGEAIKKEAQDEHREDRYEKIGDLLSRAVNEGARGRNVRWYS